MALIEINGFGSNFCPLQCGVDQGSITTARNSDICFVISLSEMEYVTQSNNMPRNEKYFRSRNTDIHILNIQTRFLTLTQRIIICFISTYQLYPTLSITSLI